MVTPASAQSTTDRLSGGTVKNPQSAACPENAAVTVRNQELTENAATTDSEGRFSYRSFGPAATP